MLFPLSSKDYKYEQTTGPSPQTQDLLIKPKPKDSIFPAGQALPMKTTDFEHIPMMGFPLAAPPRWALPPYTCPKHPLRHRSIIEYINQNRDPNLMQT